MAKPDDTGLVLGGCVVAVARLMIIFPIWYALLFGILQRVDAPAWMWVAYWVYVPVCVLSGLAEEFFKQLSKQH